MLQKLMSKCKKGFVCVRRFNLKTNQQKYSILTAKSTTLNLSPFFFLF